MEEVTCTLQRVLMKSGHKLCCAHGIAIRKLFSKSVLYLNMPKTDCLGSDPRSMNQHWLLGHV